MPPPRLHLHYAIASFLCFLVATNGSEILASALQTNTPLLSTVRKSFYYAVFAPLGTLFLALPFFGVGIVSANLAKVVGLFQAKVFFVSSVAALGALYLSGYWSAQQSLLAQKLTAAALSVGFLPFKSIAILLLASIVAALLFWREECANT